MCESLMFSVALKDFRVGSKVHSSADGFRETTNMDENRLESSQKQHKVVMQLGSSAEPEPVRPNWDAELGRMTNIRIQEKHQTSSKHGPTEQRKGSCCSSCSSPRDESNPERDDIITSPSWRRWPLLWPLLSNIGVNFTPLRGFEDDVGQ